HGTGWLQAEFPAPVEVARLVWSRDVTNRYHDRLATTYKVEVSDDGRAWNTVATDEGRAPPGGDYRVSRSAAVKALDPEQQKKRQELREELYQLGVPRPSEVRSGPQVGEGINGRF